MLATAPPLCSADVVGNHVHVHCALAGATILDTNLPISIPTVRVTLPPLPAVTRAIHLPGPTATVTAAPVIIPGGTTTHTVTIKPSPNTVTQTPRAGRTSPGQTPTSRVTITPSPRVRKHTEVVEKTKTHTIVHRVFIGALLAICLLLFAILCYVAGYYFGYKDSDRAEQHFLRSIIERLRGER